MDGEALRRILRGLATLSAAGWLLVAGVVPAPAQTADQRLIEAVRLQDSEAVERLLDASADVNAA